MKDEYDVLVVGTGPAGMAAALRLGELGLDVLVVDEQKGPGGQVWRAQERRRPAKEQSALGTDYASGAAAISRFRAAGVDYSPETQVWQIEPGFRAFMTKGGRTLSASFKTILLATGAQERPVPIPGWTLPGVMTVGAGQILLKSCSQIPEGPLWVCGSGPLPLLYMMQVLSVGGEIAGYLDTTPNGGILRAMPHLLGAWRNREDILKGIDWKTRLRRAGVPVYRHVSELRAEGDGQLREISFRTRDGQVHRQPASVLMLHEGLVPSVHTTMSMGCTHDWDEAQACFVPRLDPAGMTSVNGLYIAGDGAGIAGMKVAPLRGRIAAMAIATKLRPDLASTVQAELAEVRRELDIRLSVRPFLDGLFPPPPQDRRIDDDVIICRCEEVTAGTLRAAAKDGSIGPNQIKAFTRCGMGPCQGRQCGYSVNRLLSQEYGIDPAQVGFFRIRPPLKPITLSELASLDDAMGAA